MAVDSRYGGASHDSHVWNLSSYRQVLQQMSRSNELSNYWLLGKHEIQQSHKVYYIFIVFYYIR